MVPWHRQKPNVKKVVYIAMRTGSANLDIGPPSDGSDSKMGEDANSDSDTSDCPFQDEASAADDDSDKFMKDHEGSSHASTPGTANRPDSSSTGDGLDDDFATAEHGTYRYLPSERIRELFIQPLYRLIY